MKSVDVMRCMLVKDREVKYDPIVGKEDAMKFLRAVGFGEYADEVFGMVCVDAKGNIVGYHEVSHGDLTGSISHPREIFKRALLNNAYAIILCHNHPSGDPHPSRTDIDTTDRMKEAGEIIGIRVVDHIIMGMDSEYSFAMEGLM